MKILFVTTVGSTMDFFVELISELIHEGNTVDIATNERTSCVNQKYRDLGCKVFPISWTRSPIDRKNVVAVKELREVIESHRYDIVHCHTPIAAMCTRFACRKARKEKLTVIYTAHGFHFYSGAPIKNWLLYYPIERICSRWTDVLITINHEDYEIATKRMYATRTEYVPGVGINTEKFGHNNNPRRIREEFGIVGYLLLSVGELNDNKNHISVIKALKGLDISYAIVGDGELRGELQKTADELGVKVILTGFRNDVEDFYAAADAYILPSKREGLNVSLMEAMASGLPCIASNIRGNSDLVDKKGGFLFDPNDVDSIKNAIESIIECSPQMGSYNKSKIKQFDTQMVIRKMKTIYNTAVKQKGFQ